MSGRTQDAARIPTRRTLGILSIAGALALTACGFHPDVRSMAAPDARLHGRTTFRILDLPATNGDGDVNATPMASHDPMRENSITALAIRDQLRKVFEAKGYRYSDTDPDLEIAYYATITPALDIRAYNYGYDWAYLPRSYLFVDDYYYYDDDEGAVVVDVIDPRTKKLMWRGQSTARVSDNPDKYTKQLRKAVNAIQKRYPPPTS